MTTQPGSEPTVLRRMLAIGAALVLGTALTNLGSRILLDHVGDGLGLFAALGLLLAIWSSSPYAGLAAHDWVLRRSGAVLPPPRDPRGPRAVLAWAAGVAAGAMPATLLFLAEVGFREARVLRPGPDSVLVAWHAAFLTSPTTGLLVTRALCRRWALPPAAMEPTPPVLPAPA